MLPVVPPPIAGETVLSWLERLAAAYGLAPAALLARIDRRCETNPARLLAALDPLTAAALAEATGVSGARLQALTLGAGADRARAELPSGWRAARWPCCPLCRAADPVPHARLWWSRSWAAACPGHGTRLETAARPAEALAPEALRLVLQVQGELAAGDPSRAGGLRLLIELIVGAMRAPIGAWPRAMPLALRAGLDGLAPPVGDARVGFSAQPLAVRAQALQLLGWALADWPGRAGALGALAPASRVRRVAAGLRRLGWDRREVARLSGPRPSANRFTDAPEGREPAAP